MAGTGASSSGTRGMRSTRSASLAISRSSSQATATVKARRALTVAVAWDDDEEVGKHAARVLRIPRVPDLLAPVPAIVPLQLLAYHVAAVRGHDIDQPRNLAKSVTVE